MDYAVIMAGGSGTRLWPLSREKRPKQVLKLLEGQTLLRNCYQRLTPIFDPEKILVLTNRSYIEIISENLPELPKANIIAEPAVRDTANAIGLAAAVLSKRDKNATMAVVAADHIIDPTKLLTSALTDAIEFVNENPNVLFTFGIVPNFPATQFGYIKLAVPVRVEGLKNDIYTVKAFREKPNPKKAQEYFDSGQYFWNSGMFVWKAETILNNLSRLLPQVTEPLQKINRDWGTQDQQKTLDEQFLKLPRISIDYAVMEKADNVHAIKLECRWLDMGAFTAIADFIEADENNNVIVAGSNELLDCKDSIIVTEDQGHLIAAIGIKNIIIAHTPDATLVCNINESHRLKELLERIRKNARHKFL
ncbi:MAG: mannose-1-phosphate guanylyltransferase [Planctomycetota bacterium]|jgi:mannose-1-phosphate guanylyltransferase